MGRTTLNKISYPYRFFAIGVVAYPDSIFMIKNWHFFKKNNMMVIMKKSNTDTLTKKKLSHERIVEVTSHAIRRSGYDGTGIADIMKQAGLTHGGFYAHFASREALLAEAASHAGASAVALAASVAAAAPSGQGLASIIRAYLSDEHLQNMELGCPIAALGSEMPRQSPEVRQAATRHIKEMVDLVARQSPEWGQPSAHENALFTVAAMVGTLLLARAVDDPKLSANLLKVGLMHLNAND